MLLPELVYIARCRVGSVTRSVRNVNYFIEIFRSCCFAANMLRDLFDAYPKTSRGLISFILRESIINKRIFDGLQESNKMNVLPLIEDLSNRILENRHSTYTIRIIVKLRLITFRMGIVNYPKWLYYIVRFLYKYGL